MQSPTNSFDKISPTAIMVAYLRQFTDIPYSKEISQLVNAQAVVEKLTGNNPNPPVEIGVWIEGRYKSINKSIGKATQIIELASGLQPRGIIMSENSDITFIESDLPAMLSQKQELAQKLIGNRSNLKFIAIDATSSPSQFPLYANYLNTQKPVVITCEGLLMYLTFAERQMVFKNIRETLEIYGGVWITSDFNSKDNINRVREISPSLKDLWKKTQDVTGRAQDDYMFEDFEHVKQFANEQGFEIEANSLSNILKLEELTCLKVLNIDLNIAELMLKNAYVFALKLKN